MMAKRCPSKFGFVDALRNSTELYRPHYYLPFLNQVFAKMKTTACESLGKDRQLPIVLVVIVNNPQMDILFVHFSPHHLDSM